MITHVRVSTQTRGGRKLRIYGKNLYNIQNDFNLNNFDEVVDIAESKRLVPRKEK